MNTDCGGKALQNYRGKIVGVEANCCVLHICAEIFIYPRQEICIQPSSIPMLQDGCIPAGSR